MTRQQTREVLWASLFTFAFILAIFMGWCDEPKTPSIKDQWDQKYPANSER